MNAVYGHSCPYPSRLYFYILPWFFSNIFFFPWLLGLTYHLFMNNPYYFPSAYIINNHRLLRLLVVTAAAIFLFFFLNQWFYCCSWMLQICCVIIVCIFFGDMNHYRHQIYHRPFSYLVYVTLKSVRMRGTVFGILVSKENWLRSTRSSLRRLSK